MNIHVLAQATEVAAGPNPMFQLLFFGLIFVGFYFLFIAPQRKRQKAQEQMINNLTSGDEVLTMGGLYGTITNVKDDRFVVKISDSTKIEVNKAYIQAKIGPEQDKAGTLKSQK